jgi:hypothetical protein
MLDDYDWELLNKRLESIERSIEMLKVMFPVKEGTLTASPDYVLYEGSLTDAGLSSNGERNLIQTKMWRNEND